MTSLVEFSQITSDTRAAYVLICFPLGAAYRSYLNYRLQMARLRLGSGGRRR